MECYSFRMEWIAKISASLLLFLGSLWGGHTQAVQVTDTATPPVNGVSSGAQVPSKSINKSNTTNSNVLTYQNKKYGLSFSYPREFTGKITESDSAQYQRFELSGIKESYEAIPTKVTYSGGAISGSQAYLNNTSLGIEVSSNEEDLTACTAAPVKTDISKVERVSINGTEFLTYKEAFSNSNESYYYKSLKNGRCYLMIISLIKNGFISKLSEAEIAAAEKNDEAHLLKLKTIIQSVKISTP